VLAAYLPVSTKIQSAAAAQGEELMRERFPDGLVRSLETKFEGGRVHDFEDAIAVGFEKLVKRQEAHENPHGYVTAVATNAMLRILARAARERLPDSDLPEEGAPDVWSDPTGDEAIAAAMLAFVRGVVESWESRNYRTAMLVILEAAEVEEPLSADELAEELEDRLGQDVSSGTARQWRKRGLDRLRAELEVAEFSIGEES
jgi:DNA-directed RNA polymerase specialized sigma24 family protein